MQRFEYKVVPAPRKGEKARGLKSTEDRFAHALTGVMNQMAREGWDYQRSDTLPVEERAGLTGSRTVFQTMLVFARPLAAAQGQGTPVAQALSHTAPTAAESAPPAPVVVVAPQLGGAPKLAATEERGPAVAAPALGPAKAAE